MAVLASGGAATYVRSRNTRREERQIRISVAELNKRIQRGDKLTVVDLRHPLDVLAAPQLIPGAIPIGPNDLDARLPEIPRAREVVLYCTCPNEETSLQAYRKLNDRGFDHVQVLTGGLPAWKQAKLPLQNLYPEVEKQVRSRAQAG